MSFIFALPSQKSSSQVLQCHTRLQLCYLNTPKWEWFQIPFTHMKLSAALWYIFKGFSEHIASALRAVPVIFHPLVSAHKIPLCVRSLSLPEPSDIAPKLLSRVAKLQAHLSWECALIIQTMKKKKIFGFSDLIHTLLNKVLDCLALLCLRGCWNCSAMKWGAQRQKLDKQPKLRNKHSYRYLLLLLGTEL